MSQYQGLRNLLQTTTATHARQLIRAESTLPAASVPNDATSSLLVSEMFRSIQGEGPFMGRPSVFLRLGLCNLNCVWCDTPFTWLFNETRLEKVKHNAETLSPTPVTLPPVFSKPAELTRRSVRSVLDDVFSLAGDRTRNVVITGGEPLLHKKPLLDVVPALFDNGFTVEFETNGTISPRGLPPNTHLNVSPKLSNSLQPRDQRLNWTTLHQCLSFRSSSLKFVIDEERDLDEALHIVDRLGVDRRRVFIMPQGQDRNALREKAIWLVQLCQQIGVNYSHRLHVELWGSERGV